MEEISMDQFKPKYIKCACGDHILQIELADWFGEDWTLQCPGVHFCAFTSGYYKNKRPTFISRLKNAFKEFRGTLTHDEFSITDLNQLIELRDIFNTLIEEWNAFNKQKEESKNAK